MKPVALKIKRNCLLFALGWLLLLPASGLAVTIADYSANPAFLPGLVSPNILFLVDYSRHMVRPAYGDCYDYGDKEDVDCRKIFVDPYDDYDKNTTYYGYFNNNDKYKYATVGSTKGFSIDNAAGPFNGNWLNWLTMTQFDVVKKVLIGGNVSPAPETGKVAPNKLTAGSGAVSDKTFYKAVSNAKCTGNALTCTSTVPQTIPYDWIDTPATATKIAEEGNYYDDVLFQHKIPFDFTFFDTKYSAGTPIYMSDNGILSFDSNFPYYKWSNMDLPAEIPLWDGTTFKGTLIAPFWEDTKIDGAKKGKISAFTVGTAPRRVYVISFENIRVYYDTTGNPDLLSYQVLFFEGSSQILFQYKEIDSTKFFGSGRSATIGLQKNSTTGKKHSYCYGDVVPTSCTTNKVTNSSARFMTPDAVLYKVNTGAIINFERAPYVDGTAVPNYDVNINIESFKRTSAGDSCPSAPDERTYPIVYSEEPDQLKVCLDHSSAGLFHDFKTQQQQGTLAFRIAIMKIAGNTTAGVGTVDGGMMETSQGMYFNDSINANVLNNLRSKDPTDAAPLGEGLYEAMQYFRQQAPVWTGDFANAGGTDTSCEKDNVPTDPYCFKSTRKKVPCCKSFILLLSSGMFSHDFTKNNFGDATNTEKTEETPTRCRSSKNNAYSCAASSEGADGFLDDVAYYAHKPPSHPDDLRSDLSGDQYITLYTVNTFGGYSSGGAAVLKKASMFGGYEEKDKTTGPTSQIEYDKDKDGVPDTYFSASGGEDMKATIMRAVQAILKNSASGTSVSVLSTSASGQGGIYQAYFYPARIEAENRDVEWPGFMRSFFIDSGQQMRDDCSGGKYQLDAVTGHSYCNGTADGMLDENGDYVAVMGLNEETGEVYVKMYEKDILSDPTPDQVNIDDVLSVWEAGEKLAKMDKKERKIYTWVDVDNDGVVDGGDFSSPLTGEAFLFDSSGGSGSFSALANYGALLRAGDPDGANPTLSAADEAKAIIEFTRGNQPYVFSISTSTGEPYVAINYRNRCTYLMGSSQEGSVCDTNERVWPLGDIVNATPSLVSAPSEVYDAIYGRKDYRNFRKQYLRRRNMVYVGANDGQLHAFNAGYFDPIHVKFCKGPGTSEDGSIAGIYTDSGSDCGTGKYDLGQEMWSFVPYDLLPHLAWLGCNGTDTDPTACRDAEYTHVFYMDKRPKITDARIFRDPKYDPNIYTDGWGTIMIVGMNYGGGSMDVTADFFGKGAATRNFASAYYMFDVTNPEDPPKLLKKFTHPDLGFTTSYPVIVRVGTDKNTSSEAEKAKWFMVVGNGPTNMDPNKGPRDYAGQKTTANGKLFIFDLDPATGSTAVVKDTGVANTYMGDALTVDQDLNYTVDVLYVGSVDTTYGTDSTDPRVTGRIFRLSTKNAEDPNNWEISPLFQDTAMGPLVVSPSAVADGKNLWVVFGTGKLQNSTDSASGKLQRFYSIRDACWENTESELCKKTYEAPSGSKKDYLLSDLFNATGIEVRLEEGDKQVVASAEAKVCGTAGGPCNYGDMLKIISSPNADFNTRGWYHDLRTPPAFTELKKPSQRVLSRAVVVGGVILFTTYTPTSDICKVQGDSLLYGLHFKSGTAYKLPILGTYKSTTGATTGQTINSKTLALGQGLPTSVGVVLGPQSVTGFVQKSTGEIFRVEFQEDFSFRGGPSSWIEKDKGGGTVEIEEIYRSIP